MDHHWEDRRLWTMVHPACGQEDPTLWLRDMRYINLYHQFYNAELP